MKTRAELIHELTWEQLSNPDGTFNKNFISYEEFCKNWLGEKFTYEPENRELYANTIKRAHIRYRALKERAEAKGDFAEKLK